MSLTPIPWPQLDPQDLFIQEVCHTCYKACQLRALIITLLAF